MIRQALLLTVAHAVPCLVTWAAPNTGTVAIGAPGQLGTYCLKIDYLDSKTPQKEQQFQVCINLAGNETALVKRDNLVAAAQTLLDNNDNNDITITPALGTSINVTSVGMAKITNISGTDETQQANTYTLNKQTATDVHKAKEVIGTASSGAQGGGLVTASLLGGSASVATTSGMSGASIADSLAAQLATAGVPGVSSFGNTLRVVNIPSGTPFTVQSTDDDVVITGGVGEGRTGSVPAMPTSMTVTLALLALGGGAWVLQRNRAA